MMTFLKNYTEDLLDKTWKLLLILGVTGIAGGMITVFIDAFVLAPMFFSVGFSLACIGIVLMMVEMFR